MTHHNMCEININHIFLFMSHPPHSELRDLRITNDTDTIIIKINS